MPTFGNSAVGASDANPGIDYKDLHGPYTLVEAGLVPKLSMYLRPNAGGTRLTKPLIYANAAGDPGARMGVGPELALEVLTGGWYDFAFSPPVALPAGDYFLGLHVGSTGSQWSYAYDVNGGAANRHHYSADTYADGPSDPGGVDGVLDWDVSIYAATVPQAIDFSRFPKAKLARVA